VVAAACQEAAAAATGASNMAWHLWGLEGIWDHPLGLLSVPALLLLRVTVEAAEAGRVGSSSNR
jgi:hypothetical protein